MTRDCFIGLNLDGYQIREKLGAGAIGSVYLAEKEGEIVDQRAIKFVPVSELREGWQNEINKVTRLGLRPEVVRYIATGETDVSLLLYRWIAWDYVKGHSLRELIDIKALTIPLLRDVVACVLSVLHACRGVKIDHADLHAGNILVADPDPLNIRPGERRILVTDFGYLTASAGREMLDDYMGFYQILSEALKVFDFHLLDGEQRTIFSSIKSRLMPDLMERTVTEGDFVRNPQFIQQRFERELTRKQQRSGEQIRNIGDYLAAELLGDQYAEWQELFVPNLSWAPNLLERNICVLTGLRGCGKTTIFRRLTALYDKKLGPSGIAGSTDFTGFYLNARVVAEAFPWLPKEKLDAARSRILHYFYCCWLLEILRWLAEEYSGSQEQPRWLVGFLIQYFPELVVTESPHLISHLRGFLTTEIEKARLKSGYSEGDWALSDISFLEDLVNAMQANMVVTADKPCFFFLDDYSTPIVNSTAQHILNAVIFRRSSKVIFKVATESIESIEFVGLHGKALEQDDDYSLLDLASWVMGQSSKLNRESILELLSPRLMRNARLKEAGVSIDKLLGESPMSNADLARCLRDTSDTRPVLYHGVDWFCRLWTSSVREIISLFSDLVDDTTTKVLLNLESGVRPLIDPKAQHEHIRNSGAKLHALLVSATDPTDHVHDSETPARAFGEHLQRICDSFAQIAKFEMNKDSENQGTSAPKMARRIEITDVTKDLPESVLRFYRGLIRYGVFVRDHRGKSRRGKAVPRLYFRGMFIPYYRLAFSRHDAVTMSWNEFCAFLEKPKEFAAKWVLKSKTSPRRRRKRSDQEEGGKDFFQ